MSNDIQTIWFHGQQLITQRADNGDYFVALKPVCEGMGIDFSSQRKRLQQQAWATVVMMTTVGADGKNRNMLGVNRKTLTMWLATHYIYRDAIEKARRRFTKHNPQFLYGNEISSILRWLTSFPSPHSIQAAMV